MIVQQVVLKGLDRPLRPGPELPADPRPQIPQPPQVPLEVLGRLTWPIASLKNGVCSKRGKRHRALQNFNPYSGIVGGAEYSREWVDNGWIPGWVLTSLKSFIALNIDVENTKVYRKLIPRSCPDLNSLHLRELDHPVEEQFQERHI